MKKFLLLLFILCVFCSPVQAWQQFNDGSLNDITQTPFGLTLASVATSDYGSAYKFNSGTGQTAYMTITMAGVYPSYQSFIVKGATVAPKLGFYMYAGGSMKLNTWADPVLCSADSWHKVELIENGGQTGIDVYVDGTLSKSYLYAGGVNGEVTAMYYFVATQSGSGFIYVDDITTTSGIATPKLINEANTNISVAWSGQLMRSYPDSEYDIKLYSLTNTNNAGLIASYTLNHSPEYGYFNISRASTIGINTGVYLLEMTRGGAVLRDEYFYLDSLSNPQGFPEQLFLAGSSVSSSIYDENSHGGVISGGETIYLYPAIQVDKTYNFTYNILETPYAISTSLNTVYNTSAITSLTASYTGLSSAYNISIDGVASGSTGGQATYSHTFSGATVISPHIIAFSPDYSAPGVWGVVKDSVSQTAIKSATVSVTGTNYGKTVYTDDNGLYYVTDGITQGNSYNISVSKIGYATPPVQVAVTQAGLTTRKDFFMDATGSQKGAGLYYAPHDVAFTVWEYWYSGIGLQGITYTVYNGSTIVTSGSTDSKGMFTLPAADTGTNYTIEMQYGGHNYTEYIQPSLYEYTLVLTKAGTIQQYANNWLLLNYTENTQNVTVQYTSNKTLTGASLVVKGENGTVLSTQTLATQTGTFTFVTGGSGGYVLNFDIVASDGSTAKMSWGLNYPTQLPLFPDSYPGWLKNTLYVGILLLFLLGFGKSRSDVACGSVAVMVSLGYYFEWLICSFNLVILVWIIALGAVYLHYKRTGGVG